MTESVISGKSLDKMFSHSSIVRQFIAPPDRLSIQKKGESHWQSIDQSYGTLLVNETFPYSSRLAIKLLFLASSRQTTLDEDDNQREREPRGLLGPKPDHCDLDGEKRGFEDLMDVGGIR